jgi:anti-sigma B factor antagonist
MASLTLAHERLPGVMVIVIAGEMDATNRAQLEDYLARFPLRFDEQVVFDLAQVPFMDSSGLHVLLTCANDCRRQGGAVHLAAAQPLPARLLQITEVIAYLPVHDTIEDALAAAHGASSMPPEAS